MSQSSDRLPEAAKPRVFHHEGRRLFLIDGDPRIVDVDIANGLGLVRDRKIRDLIARQLANLSFFGPVLKVDMATGVVVLVSGDGEVALPHGGAMPPQVVVLLRAEGLLSATGGRRPTIWFLNRDQMRWIVTKSETEQADAFLRELFKVYKAWEDGALEPARPAIEPPVQDALPPPADKPVDRDRVAILHEGVAYQVDGGELKVVSTSLWRVADWNGGRLLDRHRDEPPALGPLPAADGGKGVLLDRFQVELLGVVLKRTDALFVSILDTLRAHADGHLRVDGHRLAAVMPPEEVSREYAAARVGLARQRPNGERCRSCGTEPTGCGCAMGAWAAGSASATAGCCMRSRSSAASLSRTA